MLGFNVRKLLLNEEHGAVRYKGHGSRMGAEAGRRRIENRKIFDNR